MNPIRTFHIIFLATCVALAGCKKGFEGSADAQEPPQTYLSVDSMMRTGADRLTTKVSAHWWGTSKAGYIKGYEVSVDSMKSWTYTTRQDSDILLSIPFGHDTADIKIYVRALDNLGQRDPSPAGLAYPVKNTLPAVAIAYTPGRKPQKSFPAVKFQWSATDDDGKEDIQGFDIFLNDTNNPAYNLASTITQVTLVADTFFSDSCLVYLPNKSNPATLRIKGITYNAWNRFYIRAYDRTGSRSAWARDSIFIKKPTSKVLLVNAYLSAKLIPQNFYSQRLIAIAPVFDTLQLTEYDMGLKTYTEWSTDELTQSRVFSFFRKIVWFSDDPYNSLAIAQLSLDAFFAAGGKLFMNVEFPADFPSSFTYFGFSPIEQLAVPEPSHIMRMNVDAEVRPNAALSGWPVLKSTSIISSARSFATPLSQSGAFAYDSMYRGDLIVQTPGGVVPWTGVSNVLSKRISIATQKPNLILLSLPLHRLNGNNNADVFLQKVLVQELEF